MTAEELELLNALKEDLQEFVKEMAERKDKGHENIHG